jgi:hypothetical protein
VPAHGPQLPVVLLPDFAATVITAPGQESAFDRDTDGPGYSPVNPAPVITPPLAAGMQISQFGAVTGEDLSASR